MIWDSRVLVDDSKGSLSHGEIVAGSAESKCVSGVIRDE
jgi:hypothetical protein